ncbi:hypothetical protein [Vibrio sp. ER1A]|uniref:hypothetical protein n=1 Tax=Vibrio sp. ER1A TaxID=1517681 RepID=UPI000AE3E656|nr:hypothetical protein [Vibrio sp. ER1A]
MLTKGPSHTVRYRADYLEHFPHTGLVAYLSSNVLIHYLPDKVKNRFLDAISPHLEQFEKLHDEGPDRR